MFDEYKRYDYKTERECGANIVAWHVKMHACMHAGGWGAVIFGVSKSKESNVGRSVLCTCHVTNFPAPSHQHHTSFMLKPPSCMSITDLTKMIESLQYSVVALEVVKTNENVEKCTLVGTRVSLTS
jgi:hypothetical protein